MSATPEEPSFWWIAPDGNEHSGDQWDLVSGLSSKTLPASTYIWKRGWAEWLRASRVGELASTLPAGSAEAPVAPRLHTAQVKPPARPADAPARVLMPPPTQPTNPASPPAAVPVRAASKLPRAQISPPKIILPSDRSSNPDEPKAPSSFGVIGGKARPAATHAPAPPQRSGTRVPSAFTPEPGTLAFEGGRPPMPTLGEEQLSATATLRPPAAVPPPARGAAPTSRTIDARLVERFAKADDAPDTVPPPPPNREGPTTVVNAPGFDQAPTNRREPNRPAEPLITSPAAQAPFKAMAAAPITLSRPPSELGPAVVQPPAHADPISSAQDQLSQAPVMTVPYDSTMSSEHAPESLMNAREAIARHDANEVPEVVLPNREQKERLRRLQMTVFVLGGICAVLALLAFGLVLRKGSQSEVVGEVPSASASGKSGAAPVCEIVVHPARLAPNVYRLVPPLLSPIASDGKALLGFAETNKKAVGLEISAATLDFTRSFEQGADKPLRGVVPLGAVSGHRFALDGDTSPLKNARTIDGDPAFTIGIAPDGLAKTVGWDAPTSIWPLPADSVITEPRVASTTVGHLVAFRLGGQDAGLDGKIMMGFLNRDGSKLSDLTQLDAPKYVGTPFAAASGSRWSVVFAAHAESEAWHVELVAGSIGKSERTQKAFTAPAGALPGGQIAPSIADAPSERWLLQWTEGKTGMYQVRTQLLNGKLEPASEALLLSPKGASSGQGALFSSGEAALSVYIQTIGSHDELWATALRCH